MSNRIAQFRGEIIRQLPLFPNDKKSRETLETHSLGGLLLHYINPNFLLEIGASE